MLTLSGQVISTVWAYPGIQILGWAKLQIELCGDFPVAGDARFSIVNDEVELAVSSLAISNLHVASEQIEVRAGVEPIGDQVLEVLAQFQMRLIAEGLQQWKLRRIVRDMESLREEYMKLFPPDGLVTSRWRSLLILSCSYIYPTMFNAPSLIKLHRCFNQL